MTNKELYINGKLCDLNDNFNVRINRQLLNPSELNTKDAQYSYSVTLPPTDRNQQIFSYANIEETRNKFNTVYTAELIINSVRVFIGNFRLSEISNGFKGNLYIPALKSIKDIFGELKLNENPAFDLPFADFATSVNAYNLAAATTPQMAIFPYVLYGLLPKVPINRDTNNYSARNLWDESVRIGMSDLPPSINTLLILKHIFNSQGYQLVGTAFDDARLNQLYQSYKNATDYTQPWNYGQHAKIHINGSWSSTYNKRTGAPGREFERGVTETSDPINTYICDLFDATNTDVNVTEDSGGNVSVKEINDNDGVPWLNCAVRIPTSGFYKVRLQANLDVYSNENWRETDPATGVQHISGYTENASNRLADNMYEVKLLRDWGKGDFGVSSGKIDGTFYRNNQPQNDDFEDPEAIPKYFPQVFENGQINLIDAAQNKNIVLGFMFGRRPRTLSFEDGEIVTRYSPYENPKDEFVKLAQILAAKPSLSWDTSVNDTDPTRLAIKNFGYWKYGRLGAFDSGGDNPDTDIDYPGFRVYGKVLNVLGNPVDPAGALFSARTNGFYINSLTGTPVINALWQITGFIDIRDYSEIRLTGNIDGAVENIAVTAFYDVDKQFIGYGLTASAPGVTDSYTDEAVVAPTDAVYVRFTGRVAAPITIEGDFVATDNIILARFLLEKYYTYRLTAPVGSDYTGFAYVHAGSSTISPRLVVPFVAGVAEFSTSAWTDADLFPALTIYLKTGTFDVDGTLVISRRIDGESEDVIDWELSNKYKIELINAPVNFAYRGQYENAPADNAWRAQGQAAAIVWFNAGELVTIASASGQGRYRRDGMHSTYGWVNHDINYDLSIQPFRVDADWLKVNFSGNGTAQMDWNDPVNFDTDSINLVGFLPADIKTDDFIDNFCKAYNLRLSQIDAQTFRLDVKQSKTSTSNLYVDLDGIASVKDSANAPLGLPSLYKIGFTVNVDEEGYKMTGDDGGGQFSTGVIEDSVVEQKSNFSFNWFKEIIKRETAGDINLMIPVISKFEVWQPSTPYPEAMVKRFSDLAQRFWYYDGLLNDNGVTFQFNGADLKIAQISNALGDISILNYKNAPDTILSNFFTILINGSSHYTEISAFLTPIQYTALDGTILGKFNGDLYYIAEIAGYDPEAKNMTKIKLIKL